MAETTKKPETGEKMVRVTLPIINEHDMEQYVGINGRSWLIRRGEEVEVPECVAEVLKLSENQKREAYRYQQKAAKAAETGGEM